MCLKRAKHDMRNLQRKGTGKNMKSEVVRVIKQPVLVTLYIDNIVTTVSHYNLHLYSDDTILFCSADNVSFAAEVLKDSFTCLQVAFKQHEVSEFSVNLSFFTEICHVFPALYENT
uniref:Reverse transcriptase domain-containing protein n=1 Tax=Acanthochromis polyacanthus TaxID=80966 RepID=A0A3Q1FFB7_9TELE